MNKPNGLVILFIVIAISIIAIIYLVFFRVTYITLNYIESDEIIDNPSRGFYVQFDTDNLKSVDKLKESGITLVLLAYDLSEFVDSEIAQSKLDELSCAFEILRENGLKAILRSAYGFHDVSKYSDAQSIDIIKGHLLQMKSILNENKDVILTLQAGFLGPWGEWHSSNLGEDRGKPTAPLINEILVALSDAIPQPISIAIRRPSFIRLIDPSKVDLSRIGFHNDALLSTDSDMGTYDDDTFSREDELNFIQNRPYPVANGGEMPIISEYTDPISALKELTQLKLTYLNSKYNKEVINDWSTRLYEGQPFLDFIKKKLGYRWSIQSVKLPDHFKSIQTIKITVELINTGFSAVSIPYQAELVVISNGTIQQSVSFKNIDLQSLSMNESLKMRVSLNLSELNKSFEVGLRFIDVSMSENTDPRYMIQLANQETTYKNGINFFASYHWDEEEGYSVNNNK